MFKKSAIRRLLPDILRCWFRRGVLTLGCVELNGELEHERWNDTILSLLTLTFFFFEIIPVYTSPIDRIPSSMYGSMCLSLQS